MRDYMRRTGSRTSRTARSHGPDTAEPVHLPERPALEQPPEGCPVHRDPAARPVGAETSHASGDRRADPNQAQEFIELFYAETGRPREARARTDQILAEIAATGSYRHTTAELTFGARVAWRNNNRCIGRLYWKSLRVRDRRHVTDADQIAEEAVRHLLETDTDGRIRPTVTVFAQDFPERPGPRFHNDQLIRYAGYRRPDGSVLGDPRNTELTDEALGLGWPGGPGTPFDVLPLIVEAAEDKPRLYEISSKFIREVPITHPTYPWFADLGLRWHAVPAISDMCLEIGGVCYPAAPFNGWYMGTEIGARNLADPDRYDLLPAIAAGLGIDTGSERTLWRDRALVELNLAVLHSFQEAGVTITDHHTESERFLTHLEREEDAGRQVPADWSWIVPPLSSSTTPVFHRYYEDADLRPNYARRSVH